MPASDDDLSRFLCGLYRDAGAIRVRRTGAVALGEAQEAHTRRVIAAWMASVRPDGRVAAAPRPSARARLRAALGRLAAAR